MCGRYDNLIPRDAMEQLFAARIAPGTNFPPRYNIAPTQDIPIVRLDREGERELIDVRWGLIPFYLKEKPRQPHINARAETVERTPLFREAFAKRRCLIPATGFYEWERVASGRQPYRFTMKDGDPFAFAGLWESARIGDERIRSATIIVTAANTLVGRIHDRMPVILAPGDHARWMDPGLEAGEAKALLKPFPAGAMASYAVSRRVNSHENDDEALIEPVDPDAEEAASAPAQRGLPGL